VIERAGDRSFRAYLPRCTTTTDSVEAVEAQLREAVELYLSYFRDRGLPAPPPEARVGRRSAA
jgi:predicted RNase H-like HicB family nuclease